MIVYFNGRFVPKEEVSVSPDDRGFLFGDGVYEVLCAYEGRLYETRAHWQRLKRSLREIQMSDLDPESFEEVASELLRRNDLQDRHAKVYIQVTRGAAPRQHAFPDPPVEPTVYATVAPYDLPLDKWENGVKVITAPDLRWARCDIKSVALLPNVMASQQAHKEGAYETLLVREGVVTEGSHTSFMGVFDDVVFTHPLDNRILPGVTRKVVLELCRELGIPVREVSIEADQLREASELMLLGTTTGVMPVVKVDDWQVADGQPGPVTQTLQEAFQKTISQPEVPSG